VIRAVEPLEPCLGGEELDVRSYAPASSCRISGIVPIHVEIGATGAEG